jgi:centromeric protein E
LLSAGGDAKSISHADLEGSPSQSRSSSAEGSYSTSATTFEDGDDSAGASKSNAKIKEIKGNVIVSVRVRPNVNGEGSANSEWVVDGRRGLLAYNGKEGGDYYYGTTPSSRIGLS